ncbi:MAG TPA: hypothetical protein EYH12_01275 [Psychromonas hadalis]|nr:hypothetical protein [Psychromonas hadalis]
MLSTHKTVQVRTVIFGSKQRLLIAKDISSQITQEQLRKNFISNASHELRTPLTVSSGYLELLEMSNSLPKQQKGALENANQQVQRMNATLDNMLQLYKLEENNTGQQVTKTIHIGSVIHQVVSDFSGQSRDQHFELQIDNTLFVEGQLDQLDQLHSLIQNLVSNAVKYSPTELTITIQLIKKEAGFLFVIKDQGEGIPNDDISHLTERFYRVNVYRHTAITSTGLGLSIVKNIADNMGAMLKIERELGKGATFTLKFPRVSE